MPNSNRWRRGLVVLNLVLAAGLLAVALVPPAQGQRERTSRARGEYAMVAGQAQGLDASVVWIVDSANQDMIAVHWKRGTKTLEGIGYRDLQADAGENPGR